MADNTFAPPTWRDPAGKALSCREKIKVLNENLEEIRQLAQDALEDAILMGGDEAQFRAVMGDLVATLENPYIKD
ncbi:MAG: hypothetical protein O3C65_06795 [Proteobacteria bacterium]|nr:hypothetical protein [Pseudomonadota bacterium]MDA1058383.1 hypothetical protein [Pseudomonadota bacterium]